MTSLININSPMTFDSIMMGALEVFAANNQASIISPFIVGGAMAPVAGSFCGSKLPDAQAAYETANSLNMGLLSGVNFMLHACGWLEGGLVASFEKFVMDADQLGTLHHFAAGVDMSENAQAMGAIEEGLGVA